MVSPAQMDQVRERVEQGWKTILPEKPIRGGPIVMAKDGQRIAVHADGRVEHVD